MQKVGVKTTQNVFIDYEVAGLGERIGAFLLDFILQAAYVGVLIYINFEVYTLPIFANALLILPVFLYHLFCEVFFKGQSIGKRQLNIKVVLLDGTSPSKGNYLLRWGLRPLDILPYGAVAILCILIGGKGQRLGDMAAGTTVVKYQGNILVSNQPLYGQELPQDYIVSFPQVSRLRNEDIAQIRETLVRYRRTGKPQAVQVMADKAKQILELETDMPPVKFLDVLLKDYQYINARQ